MTNQYSGGFLRDENGAVVVHSTTASIPTWSPGSYPADSVVRYSGSTYVASVTTTGTPGVSSDWSPLLAGSSSGAPAAPTGNVVRAYDSQLNLYNGGPSSLRKWHAALAAGTARLAVIGDSISEDTPSLAASWPNMLRGLLFPHINAATGSGLIFLSPNSVSEDTRVAYTGTWANGPHGLMNASRDSSTPGSALTFTPGIAGDSFKIVYATGSSWAPFTYQIDGAAAVTVTPAGGSEGLAVLSIPITNTAAHVLKINSPAAGLVSISAVELVRGTTGLRIAKIAQSGASTSMLAPPGTIAASFAALAPDLTAILLQANDYNAQTAVATYKSRIAAAITQARLTGDVLLINTVPENYGGSHPIARALYTTALYELADENDVALLDLTQRWGDFTIGTANGLYADSLTHPSTKGAVDIAQAVAAALTTATHSGSSPPASLTVGLNASIRRANGAVSVEPAYDDSFAAVLVRQPPDGANAKSFEAISNGGVSQFSVVAGTVRASEVRSAGRLGSLDQAFMNSKAANIMDWEAGSGTSQGRLGADIEILGSGNGLALKAPNGTRYRITVDNAGVINVAAF